MESEGSLGFVGCSLNLPFLRVNARLVLSSIDVCRRGVGLVLDRCELFYSVEVPVVSVCS